MNLSSSATALQQSFSIGITLRPRVRKRAILQTRKSSRNRRGLCGELPTCLSLESPGAYGWSRCVCVGARLATGSYCRRCWYGMVWYCWGIAIKLDTPLLSPAVYDCGVPAWLNSTPAVDDRRGWCEGISSYRGCVRVCGPMSYAICKLFWGSIARLLGFGDMRAGVGRIYPAFVLSSTGVLAYIQASHILGFLSCICSVPGGRGRGRWWLYLPKPIRAILAIYLVRILYPPPLSIVFRTTCLAEGRILMCQRCVRGPRVGYGYVKALMRTAGECRRIAGSPMDYSAINLEKWWLCDAMLIFCCYERYPVYSKGIGW